MPSSQDQLQTSRCANPSKTPLQMPQQSSLNRLDLVAAFQGLECIFLLRYLWTEQTGPALTEVSGNSPIHLSKILSNHSTQ